MKTNTSLVNSIYNEDAAKQAALSVDLALQHFMNDLDFSEENSRLYLDQYYKCYNQFLELQSSLMRLALLENRRIARSKRKAQKKSSSGTRALNRTLTGIG